MIDAIQKAREALKAARESFRTGRGQFSASNMILDALAAIDAPAEGEALSRECATEGCRNQATIHFIRGDVGSHYCRDCYMRVQALVTPESRS